MEYAGHNSRCLFDLPNEILLTVLSHFSTESLIPFMPTCRRIHSLVVRLLHHRLQIAAGLAGYTLYVECHHPSVQWTPTATKLFCTPLGTDGLSELLIDGSQESPSCVGAGKNISGLYSRFRPQGHEPTFKRRRETIKHPAGDVPGSRTYSRDETADDNEAISEENDAVRDTVTIDAHDLFSQLTTMSYLGQRDRTSGLLFKIQDIGEGTIRVWRDWLSQRCESKSWTDGEAIAIHHDNDSKNVKDKSNTSKDANWDPTKDPDILWANTRVYDVGIRFRVKERKWDQNAPVMHSIDVESAVNYVVEFDEVYVKTTHLLLEFEKIESMITNQSERAIIFGSYSGGSLGEIATTGGQLRYEA